MIEQELIYLIALTKMPKVGPVMAKNLISYCGSVEAVFKETKKNMLKIPGVGQAFVENFVPDFAIKEAEQELKFTQKNEITILSYLSDEYPKRLANFDSSPIVL